MHINGTVAGISRLGGIVPSFSVAEFFEAGFEYGDLVTVYLGNDGIFTVPFVTNYTDAGCLGLVLVDYRASHRGLALALSNDTLADIISCNKGENFTVVLREKGGYLADYKEVGTIYSDNREEFASDEEFANFRMITTTGMAPNLMYRSSNPFNDKRNKARRATAAKLCRRVGIKTEIDLGDDLEDLIEIMAKPELAQDYCGQLYEQDQVALLRLTGGAFAGDGANRVARAFRFILKKEGPFVIHCDEGKDRAGFVCMLLEALAGATLEDIRRDYMQTFCNYYHLQPGTEKYLRIQQMNVDRLLYIIAHPHQIANMLSLNWEMIDVKGVNPQLVAISYCWKVLKLSIEEIKALQAKLRGKK